MKKCFFIVVLGLISSSYLYSQEELKTSLNIEGQFAISTDGKGVFVNMGGPNIKFSFSKFNVSLNMFPTLRFQEDKVKSFVTPMLGFGTQIYFLKDKRVLLAFPTYYNSATNKWNFTAGIGYVLTKKKK